VGTRRQGKGGDLTVAGVPAFESKNIERFTADTLEHKSGLWRTPEYEQVKPVVASK
jgi:hypothetical protein